MAVLFSASTELGSNRRTSRFLLPVLRWLAPDLPAATLEKVQFGVRKTGHAVGYALLAAFIWRARRMHHGESGNNWRRADAAFAFGIATLFAATDEWHQTFTATRQGAVADVALDATGAAIGLVLIWLWGRWRRQW